MNTLDKILASWAKANKLDVQDAVAEWGWPSEWEAGEPYWEELPHMLNDGTTESALPPLPRELIAYRLRLYFNNKDISVDDPLVQQAAKWRDVAIAAEFDDADPRELKQLFKLVKERARGELAENLATDEEFAQFADAPVHSGDIYLTVVNDRPVWISADKGSVAFMDEEGNLKMYDYDGNKIYADADMSKVQNHMVRGMKSSRRLTKEGELASLIGNTLAALVTGDGGISIMDLP